jgi:hypothetical protein
VLLQGWLNAMAFSPSYFHNTIASSSSSPVMYLDLSPFFDQIHQSLSLCQEQTEVEQAQGRYRVTTYKYRAVANVKAGTIVGSNGGIGGAGPGGVDIVHEDWSGQVVLQTEGTTEHAQQLLTRCTPVSAVTAAGNKQNKNYGQYRQQVVQQQQQQVPATLQPWRVLRERSRPGKLWIRVRVDLSSSSCETLFHRD